jgi:glycosyltransferase involved in cell wall biosynthesis
MKANYPGWFRKRVDFRGHMRHSDVMAIRTDHYIPIIAARIDTMGYMLLEPMSLGCPLITTAVGGIPEFLHDRENALLVASEDAKATACAMKALIDDPSLASRIGKRAWKDCDSLYSAEVVARQSLAAYERAIEVFKYSSNAGGV